MMQMTVSQTHRASYLEVAVDHHLPWDNVVVAVVLHTQEVADLLPILGVVVDHRVPPMMVAAEVHSPVAVRDSNSHVLPRDDAVVVAVDSNSVPQHYCVVVEEEEHVLDDDSSREEHDDEEEDADSHSNQTNWVARVGVPSKHRQHLVVVDPGKSVEG